MKRLPVLLFLMLLFGLYQNCFSQKFRDTNLSVSERINDLLVRLTCDEKINMLITGSEAIPGLGIDKYYHGNEGLHGVVRPGKFTVFPQAIGLAATWNPQLINKVSMIISDEARAKWNFFNQGKDQKARSSDLLTLWSPNINMARDPRWGRTPETYGEDPFLTSKIGVEFVKGLQGTDSVYLKVVATPKHFVANNEEHNRLWCNAKISERAIREYYFPAFKSSVVEGKAQAIMSAYNAINDVPCSANSWLLNDILREEWGFNGYVVTDCGALRFLVSHHKNAQDYTDAAAKALRAGADLDCDGEVYRNNLKSAYELGKISQADIDTAVYRVLRARFKLGIFDPVEDNPYSKLSPEIIGSKKHQQIALETALQSMVLLKNEDNLLPLKLSKYKKIAVLGPNAANAVFGGYSGSPVITAVTPLAGIRKKVEDKIEIVTVPWNYVPKNYSLIEKHFFTTPTGDKNGLSAEYFNNNNLDGKATKRIDAVINFDLINQPPDPVVPKAPMSICWSGYINPPVTGKYKLAIKSNQRVRVLIDGKLELDNWVDRSATLKEFTAEFIAGTKYALKVEYLNTNSSSALCRLMWQLPKLDSENFFAEDKKVAVESDLVIAVLGLNTRIEGEGVDRKTIDLPQIQREYIKEIYGVNKNIVVVLVAGSSLSINWINENIPAVLNAWYPGESGGTAIADVLFGDYNPGGRLPLTYYKSADDLMPFDDYEISKGRTYMYFEGEPLYPFGFGLSYTTFSYSKIHTNKNRYSISDTLKVSVDITNTGDFDGDEVVQLYVTDVASSIKRPIKELKGFKRISLAKGETQKVMFEIPVSELKFWDTTTHNWKVEPGEFAILVGSSSKSIKLTKKIEVI